VVPRLLWDALLPRRSETSWSASPLPPATLQTFVMPEVRITSEINSHALRVQRNGNRNQCLFVSHSWGALQVAGIPARAGSYCRALDRLSGRRRTWCVSPCLRLFPYWDPRGQWLTRQPPHGQSEALLTPVTPRATPPHGGIGVRPGGGLDAGAAARWRHLVPACPLVGRHLRGCVPRAAGPGPHHLAVDYLAVVEAAPELRLLFASTFAATVARRRCCCGGAGRFRPFGLSGHSFSEM
jgi:hypothetical protein